MNTPPLSEPVFVRKGLSLGLLTFLWTVFPAALSAVNLYACALFFGEQFSQPFSMLLVVVIALGAMIMQSARGSALQLTYSTLQLSMDIAGRWVMLLFALLAIGFLVKLTDPFPRRVLLTWAVTTPIMIICASLVLRYWMRRLLLDESNRRRVVIAGYNEASQSLAMRIQQSPGLGMSVEGFFDDRSTERLGAQSSAVVLGGLQQLVDFVRRRGVEVIFVALPIRNLQRVVDLLEDLRDTTASIYYVPDIFVFDLIQARTSDIQGIPVVALCETPFYGSRELTKRLFDLVLSTTLLVALSPALLLIALLVRLTSTGPAIFKQRRYGLDGEEITVYKFRTMTVIENGPDIRQATRSDPRITPIGRFLRRYSLDELPQLVNVIQGRMSLVGPRPHAVAHNELYRKLIKGYMLRHKVRPGITGLAQANGFRGETRNIGEMEARINYDLEYLRRWSTLLDVKILFMTVIAVFTDKRAY